MGTTGKKWTRKDRKWNDEIMEFVKSVCPLREHGLIQDESLLKKSIEDLAESFLL